MKKIRFFIMIFMCGLFLSHGGTVSAQVSGTEDPASYGGDRERIMQREERIRRSQVIQDVSRTYREMVAAYKANRILHAEEMSQKLYDLLDDPILPSSFSKRMEVKHENFLQRVYRGVGRIKMDVPTDDVSDAEIVQIQQVLHQQGSKSLAQSRPESEDAAKIKSRVKESVEIEDRRDQPGEERLAQKITRRQKKLDAQEDRRERRLALKEKRKAERSQRAAQREASRRVKQEEDRGIESLKEIAQAQQQLDSVDREIRKRQGLQDANDSVSRLAALQAAALDVKKEKVDQYVRMYREEMQKEQQLLQETFSVKIDGLYQDGVEFYEKNAYQFAYDVFLEVEKLYPDYKKTRHYLSELERYFKLRFLDSERSRAVAEALDTF